MEGPGATSHAEWPAPWSVRIVAETGSTNADLLAAGEAGAPHGSVLVADHQTAGRGRLDRGWSAPPGANLLVSVLFRDLSGPPHHLTQRTAVAAARACETVAGVQPTLKWPNDLLLDERKLAGVLAQAGAGGDGRIGFVVVGLGLNIGWAPERAARLPRGSRDEVLAAFLDELTALPDDISAEYRSRLGTIGEEVRVEMPDGVLTGVATDVDADGRLLLTTTEGHRAVDVGDVIHMRRSPR